MSSRRMEFFITCIACILGVAALSYWLGEKPSYILDLRVAKPEEHTPRAARETSVNIEGLFQQFSGIPSQILSSWPRFRGGSLDNIYAENIRLSNHWGDNGPKELWAIDLGEGYAGPAVHNGRVYVLDYDEKEKADALRCFSLDDGREIWRRSYKVDVKRNHGMSRTVPAVTDDYVVTIGPKCHVMTVQAVTGDYIWGMDLVSAYGTTVPLWYTGQCPLIDGDTVVIAPGGSALMIGIDLASGEVLWETPNPRRWEMSHSSIIPMTFHGRKMYVYAAIGGMAGVAADGEDRGKVLWETTEWNHSVIAPSPVQLPGNRIMITAGYGVGSMMLAVGKEDDGFSVKPIQRWSKEVFACEQHTPILYKGHLYTVLPNDAGAMKRQAVCMDLDGKVIWTSGTQSRFGLGPFLIADDKLFVLDDNGLLTMAKATHEGYVQLDQAKVLQGKDAWGPMALVDGRLILRDLKRMICLDLRGR